MHLRGSGYRPATPRPMFCSPPEDDRCRRPPLTFPQRAESVPGVPRGHGEHRRLLWSIERRSLVLRGQSCWSHLSRSYSTYTEVGVSGVHLRMTWDLWTSSGTQPPAPRPIGPLQRPAPSTVEIFGCVPRDWLELDTSCRRSVGLLRLIRHLVAPSLAFYNPSSHRFSTTLFLRSPSVLH